MRLFNDASRAAIAASAFGFACALAGAASAQGAFTTWPAALTPGASVNVGGLSQEITYASSPGGVTSATTTSTAADAGLTETLDANGQPTTLGLRSGARNVNFVKANGDTFTSVAGGRATYARASDWTRNATLFDPTVMGWTYQTFGVWESGVGQSAGSIGGMTVGAATAGGSVPQTGVADFAGAVGGVYVDATGQSRTLTGDMGMKVNFANHSADFWTGGMQDNAGRIYNDLAITGTFVGLPNHQKLYGTLSTARLTGTSTAQFYGPAAEEIGGVFALAPKSGTGLERFAGAFGGKRAGPTARLPARVDAAAPASATAFASWLGWSRGAAVLTGTSQELFFTRMSGGGTVVDPPTEVGGGSFTVVIGDQGFPTRFGMATPNQTLDFSQADGDSAIWLRSDPRVVFLADAVADTLAMTVDAGETGWNYQTFGAWATFTGPGAGNLGVVSAGAATAASAIPTTGTGTFAGMVGGAYVEADGSTTLVSADMTLAVDFAARSAAFAAGNLTDILYRDVYNGTALSGTLTYAAKTNALTGALNTANGRLSGTATGQFFGPAAEEVGGTFVLTPTNGAGLERLVGAFGAKR